MLICASLSPVHHLQLSRDDNCEEQHTGFLGLRERDCHINLLQSKRPFLFIYQSACSVPCKTSENIMKPRNLLWEAAMVSVYVQTSRDRCGLLCLAADSCLGSMELCWSISTPSLSSWSSSRLLAWAQLLLDPGIPAQLHSMLAPC